MAVVIRLLTWSLFCWPAGIRGSFVLLSDSGIPPCEKGLYGGAISNKGAAKTAGVVLEINFNTSMQLFPKYEWKWLANGQNLLSVETNKTSILSGKVYNSSLPVCFSMYIMNQRQIFSLALNTSFLPSGENNVTVRSPSSSWHFQIKECDENSGINGNSGIKVTPIGRGIFKSPGNISCKRGDAELVITSPRQSELLRTAVCNENATWNGLQGLGCWYAPNVTFNASITNMVYRSNSTLATTVCIVEEGNPDNAILFINWNKTSVRLPLTLKPEHNNATMFCEAENNLTRRSEFSRKRSENFTLKVQFGPHNISIHPLNCEKGGNGLGFDANLSISLSTNPESGHLEFYGIGRNKLRSNHSVKETEGCCNVKRQQFELSFTNVTIGDIINITYLHAVANKTIISGFDLGQNCSDKLYASTTISSTMATTSITPTTSSESSPITIIAAAASASGVLLIVAVVVLVILIRRRRGKSGSDGASIQNPAFDFSPDTDHSERQECQNVLYGTADDLKSGGAAGGHSREEVDNVLYGTTTSPQASDDVYTTVNKPKKNKDAKGSGQPDQLYSSVQKPKKVKGKPKAEDAGASTSGLQSEDTYAEVKKDKKQVGKGKENAGFSGGLQQDATYAAVDKKKGKGAKGKKSANEPGTSAMIEEATYAQVNKNDKKPKDDDGDLHGSNKA